VTVWRDPESGTVFIVVLAYKNQSGESEIVIPQYAVGWRA
jgi:hypothetical protein